MYEACHTHQLWSCGLLEKCELWVASVFSLFWYEYVCMYVCVISYALSHITYTIFFLNFLPFLIFQSCKIRCVLIIPNFISPCLSCKVSMREYEWIRRKWYHSKTKGDFISFSGVDSSVFSCIQGSSTKVDGSITWLFSIYLHGFNTI